VGFDHNPDNTPANACLWIFEGLTMVLVFRYDYARNWDHFACTWNADLF